MRNKYNKERKKILEHIEKIIKPFEKELDVKLFTLKEIHLAILWAKIGHIAIHENYASKRKRIFHVISQDEDKIAKFCEKIGINCEKITKKELFKFSHVDWSPFYEPLNGDKKENL